jgi:hypothetical protein
MRLDTREVERNLARAAARMQAAEQAAVKTSLEAVKTKAQAYTPVQSGVLRASAEVGPVEVARDTVTGSVAFTAPYALAVHEDLAASHATGGAKFLERALQETPVLALAAAELKRALA